MDGRECGALPKLDKDGEDVAVGDAWGLGCWKSPRTCGGMDPLPR
jgi:hypothetical protein